MCGVSAKAPPLSVVVTTRGGVAEVQPVLEALAPQVERTGAEVIVVGGPEDRDRAPDWVVRLPDDDGDMLRIRLRGIQSTTGKVIAIGEDHAIPRPDWCEAVIRAHAENPDRLAVAGSLVNGTDRTFMGRTNFDWFASPFQPPLDPFCDDHPPPASVISIKRDAIYVLGGPGDFEGALLPRLSWDGQIAPDGRIVTDHYQDHGLRGSLGGAFHGGRSTYGHRRSKMSRRDRRQALGDIGPRLVLGPVREAWRYGGVRSPAELAVIALLGLTTALGCAVGILRGPGRSGSLVP